MILFLYCTGCGSVTEHRLSVNEIAEGIWLVCQSKRCRRETDISKKVLALI